MRKIIKKIIKFPKLFFRKRSEFKAFTKALVNQNSLKLVLGAGKQYQAGWVPIEEWILDITNKEDWDKYFQINSVNAMLAEHVLEHLTETEVIQGATLCFEYLKPGGYFRIAVPDGYHSSPDYINAVKPGGTGAGSGDHKILYNYQIASKIFEAAGFTIELLEWFDENQKFHFKKWDKENGMIHRSKENDSRNIDGKLNYTSLILDAWKK